MGLSWGWRLAGVLGRVAVVGVTVACVAVIVSAESRADGATTGSSAPGNQIYRDVERRC